MPVSYQPISLLLSCPACVKAIIGTHTGEGIIIKLQEGGTVDVLLLFDILGRLHRLQRTVSTTASAAGSRY